MRLKRTATHFFVAAVASVLLIGCSATQQSADSYSALKKAALDTVKARQFDGGKMWTFDHPPVDYFKQTYNFNATKEWLDDVRLSALRLTSGCTASFISGDGLVMTNHHCVRGSLASVQKPGENLLENGFYASRIEDERKISGLQLEQLIDLRDVTNEINAAMASAPTDTGKITARSDKMKEIEKANSDETKKIRAQVVTFYNGGKYSLYLYRQFNDIRLVFTPELQAAHFGGEYDNFTYPRYAFDCSFIRVYEDGKPYRTEHFYKWSQKGADEGELVFVVGNPGRTGRLNTTEQLEFLRDVSYPYTFQILTERLKSLDDQIRRHPDRKDALFTQKLGIANGWKSYLGRLDGLRNDIVMQRRRDFDRQFRSRVEANPQLKARYGHIWDEIAESRQKLRAIASESQGLRFSGVGGSELLARAANFVQYAVEMAKPDAERVEAFRGDRLLRSIAQMSRFSQIDAEFDAVTLAKQLTVMQNKLGADDPIVRQALQGQSVEKAAQRLVSSTIMTDTLKCAQLFKDPAAIMSSDDPMIGLVRASWPRIDKVNALNKEISTKDQVNAALLGQALFEVYGTAIPPDATFTLRLADGVVAGYPYNGTKAPAWTTFYGLYDRAASFPNDDEWKLAPHWKNPPPEFNLSTPCNFSSTNDIIGGNSGSPMINKNKEIVGLIFDGNMESLPGDFIFAEDLGNRTVSVHSAGLYEAIRVLYKADRLAREMKAGKME
jgi:hypothetical protein